MKKAFLVLSVIVLALTMAVTALAQTEPGTIADTVVAAASGDPAEFTVLLAAVQAADPAVLELLSNPDAQLTVFAPTDAAFAAAFEAMGVTAEEVLADPATLTSILQYHVVPGVFAAADVAALDGSLLGTTLPETALLVTLDGSTVRINNAAVLQTDIQASNGVIHVIDGVLLPPMADTSMATEDGSAMEAPTMSIADTVVAVTNSDAPEFTTLLAAVLAADPAILDSLTNGGPYTVFAPTDAAFEALLASLNTTAADLLANTDLLNQVLAYHVVPGEFSAATVMAVANQSNGAWVATLLPGGLLNIIASDMGVTVNGVNVTQTDVFATNGVIHVIDGVLLPPTAG